MKPARMFAGIVLGGLFALCLGVLVLVIVRRSDTLFYFVAPIVGLVLVGLTQRAREETRVNIAVSVVALGLALYAVELVLFFAQQAHYSTRFEYVQRRIDAARALNVPYDLRSQLEVVEDLEAQGVHAVARVHPAAFVPSNGLRAVDESILPVSGISRTVTVTCNESGVWTLFESDEHGFRNPLGQYDRDSVDVVVVGDSYAFGACLPQGEGVSSALRRTGRSVLNLGYGGNGPLLELAALKEHGERFAPPVVLWLYFEGNDLLDLRRERLSSLLLNYLDPDFTQRLSEKQVLIDSLLYGYHDERQAQAQARARRLWRCVLILCGVRKLPIRPQTAEPVAVDLPVDFFGEVMETARDRVRLWGGELLFVYVPVWHRYSQTLDQDAFNKRRDVLEMLGELGIPMIDFTDVLDSHPDPLSLFPFRERGHYTQEGYALLADQIAVRLDKSPE
jgi:hypothetical protein